MNRYYIIVPILLMAAFVWVERDAAKETHAKEQAKIAAETKRKEDEATKKRELEEKAKIDAEKRNAERLKEEQERDAKKKKENAEKIQKLKDDVKRYTDDVEVNTKKVAQLEKDLAEKRELHERENRAVFEFAKKVELSKKLRRDAELEVQRYNEILARRASESILANPPASAIPAK
jgi:translation initiation factor IF-2